jgi:hypothetical protein
MAVSFSDTASLVLRITGSQPWSGLPNITQKGSILSYEELDNNQWQLYSWSLQLDNLSRGAAYTGSPNIFTSPQTFQGAITASGPVDFKSGFITTGSGRFTATLFGGGGLILDGGAVISGPISSSTGFSGSGKDLYDVTASIAETASYTLTSSFAENIKIAGGYNGITLVNGPNGLEASASQNINALATTASINELAGKVVLTSSFNTYTGSINNWTSSAVTTSSLNNITSSFVTTSSFNNFTGSIVNTSSFNTYTGSINNWTSSVVTTSSFNAFTASYNTGSFQGTLDGTAATASYINLVAGPGISINRQTGTNLLEITSSVRSVNGIFPTDGNIPLNILATYTGDSASLEASADPSPYPTGSIFVISGDATPSNNGKTFILISGSGGNTEWVELTGFDTAAADARYLKLDASNDPMQGALSMGNFQINGLADGTISTDVINLGQLTQSVNASTGSLITLLNASSSTLTNNLNASSSTIISLLNNSSSALITLLNNSSSTINDSINNLIASQSFATASIDELVDSVNDLYTGSYVSSSIGLDFGIFNITFNKGNGSTDSVALPSLIAGPNITINQSLTNGDWIISGSGGSGGGVTAVSQSNSFPWTLTFYSGSDVITTLNLTGSSTASYVDITGSGVLVNYNGSQIQLTGSSSDNLQDVTTRGNQTSQSINIWNGIAVNITGSRTFTHGVSLLATGDFSHAQGNRTTSSGFFSHAQGRETEAVGISSHAEGRQTTAVGDFSHTEGQITRADGLYSHAEGFQTTTVGLHSHTEGFLTTAVGTYSHAEGTQTRAIGNQSHAEGGQTTAVGASSHTEGTLTTAKGNDSHAEGIGTITSIKQGQHAEGTWNIEDANAIWVVGDGTDATNRSNLIAAYTNKVTVTGSLEVNNNANTAYLLPPVITVSPITTAPYNSTAIPTGAIVYSTTLDRLMIKKGQPANWVSII